MYASETLTAATRSWRAAADALLSEAERIGPLDEGVFGDLGTDDEGEASAARIDEQFESLLTQGEAAFAELQVAASTSLDARYQATSLLVGTLAIADALSLASEAPTNVFGELSVQDAQVLSVTDARTILAETDAIVQVPKSVDESLRQIQSVGATESWNVLSGSVGSLAGNALMQGLDGILKGAAAAAFDAIVGQLKRWRDAFKRGIARVAKWIVSKLKELLPGPLADKLDTLVKAIQEKIAAGASTIAADLYGQLLGRSDVEKVWRDAVASGKDLAAAEDKLGAVTESHTGRIGWVTKGRKMIDRFEIVFAGALAEAPPPAQIAFAALVVAVLAFVAFQVWDGFNDVEGLV